MSAHTPHQYQTPADASSKAAPGIASGGASRSYWNMSFDKKGKAKSTDVADENTLRVPPGWLEAEENAATTSFNAIKEEDMSQDQLSQEIDNSQYSVEPAAKRIANSVVHLYNLSGEQKAVLNIVLNQRKNIFFTGAAGTGKSVLLRCIIEELNRKYGRHRIGVTALTGIAACNIGGQTLHRFAGIGLGTEPVKELVDRIKSNRGSLQRWQTTEVLLIDEVSMLDVDLLEKLDEIGKIVRGNNIAFGGIQVVCTGDLFQLPPVQKANGVRKFCFETPKWDQIIEKTVNLTQVFRQNDPHFVNILNDMRLGRVNEESDRLLSQLSRVPKLPKGIVPAQLFSTRKEVLNANENALNRLVGTEYVYDCFDWKSAKGKFTDIGRNVLAEEKVKLKVGAQVMLIKNIDNTLVNGSIGRVVAFMSCSGAYKEYGAGDPAASHFRSRKVQKTGSIEDDTALMEQMLGAYGRSASAIRKRRLAEDMTKQEAERLSVLPVVKFVTPNNTVRFMMVYPEVWEMTDFEGDVMASRTQLPLILAWALSVHKAQGQTLPYVCVDLRRTFESGQAYVAISRATSIDGLQVKNFSPRKVFADQKVVGYYEQLEKISEEEIIEGELAIERRFKAHAEAMAKSEEQMQARYEEILNEERNFREHREQQIRHTEEMRLQQKKEELERQQREFLKLESEADEDDDVLFGSAGGSNGSSMLRGSYVPESDSSQPPAAPARTLSTLRESNVQQLRESSFQQISADSDGLMFSEPDFEHEMIDHISGNLRDAPIQHLKRPHIMLSSSQPYEV